jgi:hypothetical protein
MDLEEWRADTRGEQLGLANHPMIQPHISVPYAIKHCKWLVSTQDDPEHKLEKARSRLSAVQ